MTNPREIGLLRYMGIKRVVFDALFMLAPVLLTLVPWLRVTHHHGEETSRVVASSFSRGDCSCSSCGWDTPPTASAPDRASPDGGGERDPNHSTDTCATCQTFSQLAAIEIRVPTAHLSSLNRPELRRPQSDPTAAALRQSSTILPRAPPIPA